MNFTRRFSIALVTLVSISACDGERTYFPAPTETRGQDAGGRSDESDAGSPRGTPPKGHTQDSDDDSSATSVDGAMSTSPTENVPGASTTANPPGDPSDPSGVPPALGTGAGTTLPPSTTSTAVAPTLILGETCSDDDTCKSGLCVDGVCCNARCDGVCEVCNSEGSKGLCAAPESDTACATLSCPEDSECRTYSSDALARNCSARGQCASEAECPALDVDEGTACNDAQGQCDGAGECAVANKASLGNDCEDDAACASGHCADGVCCETACNGDCSACGEDGRCDVVPQDDAACESITCPASDECMSYPEPLTENRCATLGQCESETTYCQAEVVESDACEPEDEPGDDSDDSDGTSECDDGEVSCAGDCIDPASDPTYCGAYDDCAGDAAGEECAEGSQCISGECRGWSSSVLVDDDALTIFSPMGAITHDGTAIVVWQQYPDGEDSQSSVRARIGATWSGEWDEEELVATADDWTSPALSAVVTLGEDLVVIGSAYDEATGNTLNWSRVRDEETGTWQDFQTIQDQGETGYSFMPNVTARDGIGLVTWNQMSADNDSYDVWARIWNAADHNWGEALRLEETELESQIPIPVISFDGELFVLWQQQAELDGPDDDLWGARYDGEGFTDVEMLGRVEGHGSGFSLVGNSQGDVFGVWQGRWIGTVWSNGEWQEVQAEGDWFGGTLCDLQNDGGDALLYWSVGGDGAYTQAFDGSTGELVEESISIAEGDPSASVIVGCGYGAAYASWQGSDAINQAARWSRQNEDWDEASELGEEGAGIVSSVSIAGDGSALLVWPTKLEYGAGGVVAAFYH